MNSFECDIIVVYADYCAISRKFDPHPVHFHPNRVHTPSFICIRQQLCKRPLVGAGNLECWEASERLRTTTREPNYSAFLPRSDEQSYGSFFTIFDGLKRTQPRFREKEVDDYVLFNAWINGITHSFTRPSSRGAYDDAFHVQAHFLIPVVANCCSRRRRFPSCGDSGWRKLNEMLDFMTCPRYFIGNSLIPGKKESAEFDSDPRRSFCCAKIQSCFVQNKCHSVL